MNAFPAGRSPGRTLIGVLLLVLGLASSLFVVLSLARDVSIWVLGRHVQALVVDRWAERTSVEGERELTFRYFVRYKFATPRGQVIAGTSAVGAGEWSGLGIDSPVDVVYFPIYPVHNRLDESRFVPILTCAYLPLFLLGCAGLVAFRHLTRATPASVEIPSIKQVLR